MSIGDFFSNIGSGMVMGATWGMMSQLGGGYWGSGYGLFGGFPSVFGYGMFDCYHPHHCHHHHGWWC